MLLPKDNTVIQQASLLYSADLMDIERQVEANNKNWKQKPGELNDAPDCEYIQDLEKEKND